MAEPRQPESPEDAGGAGGFDVGFEGHRRRQVRLGLTLSPAERLRWLEETIAEMRGVLGRARKGRPVKEDGG